MAAHATKALPVDTTAKLASLRSLMRENDIQAYLIPSDDAHGSEYVAAADKRREWISGFSGSAGTALVMEKDEAFLFTDGRYHQQAAKELCSSWTLQKWGLPDVKNWQEYLTTLPPSTRIGLDPTLLSISDYSSIKPTLTSGRELISVASNLVDKIWGSERPARPAEEVFVLDTKYAGVGVEEKIEKIREELRKKEEGVKGLVVSMLDEICWTLNLRGSDIPFNPVFFSYLYIPIDTSPTLFINIDQLSQKAYEHLSKAGVRVEPYDDVVDFLTKVGDGLESKDKVVVPSRTNLALAQAIGIDKQISYRGPIGDLKAVKNSVEIEGFRQCHIRDGVALTRYFSWLERQLLAGVKLSESAAALKLEQLRSELPLYKGLSFTTISSTGANASIIHYQPDEIDSSIIDKDEVYLCDSGAQFLDGTTDTTRTLHFGTPKPEEIRAATRVLQGHIAIDELVFPSAATGYILDAFARRPLWQDGLDYRHGTGHGVGSFLNVHEGPHGLGTRLAYNDVKLKAGFTISNEPGYYEDGKFGIRIENVVVVKKVESKGSFGGEWLGMERVTMVPISLKLVEKDLLSKSEVEWLNAYHKETREKLEGFIKESGDEEALEWLIRETREL